MAKKWIQKAIKRPGQLHRDLGVPQGEKIPKRAIAAAAKRKGAVGKRARLAQTLASLRGSPPMTTTEVTKGYRSLGRGLPPMTGKPQNTENRGEGY